MPHIPSHYHPPAIPLFRWGHGQTIFPTLFRPTPKVRYRRQRLETDDGDFLDLDWSEIPGGSRKLAIIAHGMEGSSRGKYVLGMVRTLNASGWNTLSWNMRGCSGVPNRRPTFYHSGKTDDLAAVVEAAMHGAGEHRIGDYAEVALVGFSMGGNVTLKFLGELGTAITDSSRIRAAAVFSVPCDLEGCSNRLARPQNALYMRRFLRLFRSKIRMKMKTLPGRLDDKGFSRIRDFKGFDDRYTAPDFGYACAEDYWRANSSQAFLERIAIPTLLVNAKDDPFLSEGCFPFEAAKANPHLFLETPDHGGHCGFIAFNLRGRYWCETRALEFLEEHVTAASPRD